MTESETTVPTALDAGIDWERLAAERRRGTAVARPVLETPASVVLRAGRGQVTIDWRPVPGAAGYLVRRSSGPDGEFEPLDIGEEWVRPVPHPPLTDTSGSPGCEAWYTVAAVANVDDRTQVPSEPLRATPFDSGEASCRVEVRAATDVGPLHRVWQTVIGAERLSQLDHGVGPGGRHIGREFEQALRLAHDELGVRAVRAHAILHDDLGVYREVDGEPRLDFTGVDRIYDRILDIGLRPVVEVGFMPHDLASDPTRTVFDYRAIVSPPKDWDRWAQLVGELAAHLVERYGLDEVRSWDFEIWNEPDLDVFWSGDRGDYWKLYDISARAVKDVDRSLTVGGPASAAVAWIDDLLVAVNDSGAPIDFLSTHCYGQAPLDLRPIAARHGRADLRLLWTEWGAQATHFSRVHDSVWSAAYTVRGMVSAMGRLDALAYWTVSDHFEELGRPTTLLHGGFGLLGLGNLRKPRWWAIWMLNALPDRRVHVAVDGDGAGDMVDAIASRDPGADGRIAVLVWNGTVDGSKSELSATGASGADRHLLERAITVDFDGLDGAAYRLRHRRLDEFHSNLNAVWRVRAGGRDWPSDAEYEQLAAAADLADYEPPRTVRTSEGTLTMTFTLPMPGLSLIELQPVSP